MYIIVLSFALKGLYAMMNIMRLVFVKKVMVLGLVTRAFGVVIIVTMVIVGVDFFKDYNSHKKYAESLVAEGDELLRQGNSADALDAYQIARLVRQNLVLDFPADVELQSALSDSYDKIGDTLRSQGDIDGALSAYKSALEIKEKLNASVDAFFPNYKANKNIILPEKDFEKIATRFDSKTPQDFFDVQELWSATGSVPASSNATIEAIPKIYAVVGAFAADISPITQSESDYTKNNSAKKGVVIVYPKDFQGNETGNWGIPTFPSYIKIGDALIRQNNYTEAVSAYKEANKIAKEYSDSDPDNAEWKHGLFISHVKLAKANSEPFVHLKAAVDLADDINEKGVWKIKTGIVDDYDSWYDKWAAIPVKASY